MIAAMAARSPARFIAPLALLAFALALFLVVSRSSTDSGSAGSGAKTTKEQPVASPAADGGGDAASKDSKGPRFYRVKAGDTPSAIAERTGVPLSQIMELNPDLDPQTLAPGQRIKLRTK
jgi:LysM repeat protein